MNKKLIFFFILSFTIPTIIYAQTTDDTHSTIEGQLVPVGEKNKYTYKYKKWNISTNPLGYMIGFFGLSTSYALNKNIALRGDIEFISLFDTDIKGGGISISAPIYFKKMYDGFFFEPGFRIMSLNESTNTGIGVGPMVLVGWHWIWDSGLNISMALGSGYTWLSENTPNDGATSSGVLPAGYFRIGYAF